MFEVLPGVSLARCTPPHAKPQFVLREKLLAKLEAPAPIALIAMAPSGYGKTVLASQWASKYPDRTIWYTASEKDTPRDTFFHHIQSFRLLIPDFAPWVEDLRTGEFDYVESVTHLANDIAKEKRVFHMVYDGAEKLSPDHLGMLQLWNDIAPLNLRTLTTRKSSPQVSLSRITSLGALLTLFSSDLALSELEIEKLAQIANVDISHEENLKLLNSVHGWPAGVQILMSSIVSGRNISFNNDFADDDIESSALIGLAVESLKTEDRGFLRTLSIFEFITPSRVEALMGNFTGRELMRKFAKEGLFIRALGSQDHQYEINPMVRRYLLKQLREDSDNYLSLSKRAAEILVADGDALAAVEIYVDLNDLESARRIIGSYSRKMIYTSDADRLRRWNKLVGSVLNVGDLGVELADAYASMLGDPLSKFRSEFSTFNARMKGDPQESELLGDLAIISLRLDFSMGDYQKCLETIKRIPDMKMVQPENRTAKIVSATRWGGWAAFLKEDLNTLRSILSDLKTLPTPNDGMPILGIPACESMVALGEGRYKDAEELAQYVIDASEKYGFAGIFTPFDAVYVLAEVHREMGNNEVGVELLNKYIPLAEKAELYPWVAALNVKYARLLIAQNQISEGFAKLKVARDAIANPLLNSEISYIVDEQELFIRYSLNDIERTNELLYRLGDTSSVMAMRGLTAAKKNSHNVASELAKLPRSSIREQLNYEIIYAEVTINKPKVAQEHLEKAIILATANGQRQIFLNRSTEFLTLFLQFAQSAPSVFVEQLAGLIRTRLSVPSNSAGLVSPLTKRELDILRRLSTGLPISQIAEGIHISNNTIKTHLKNVYKKLEVDSREAAVTKGRELLLIS